MKAFFLILSACLLIGCQKESPPNGGIYSGDESPIEARVYDSYKNNALAADEKYLGHLVEFKTFNAKLVKDGSGYAIQSWATAPARVADPPSIICRLSSEGAHHVANCKLADVDSTSMTIVGRCQGIKQSGAWDQFTLTVSDCDVKSVLTHSGKEWIAQDGR